MGCAASVEAVASDGKRLLPEGVAKLDSKAPQADPPATKEDGAPKAGPPASNASAPEAKPTQGKSPADATGPTNGSSPATNTSVAIKEANAERFKDGEATVVFVLGGPGCGKGTQCARMVADFGFQHLSAGDLLRAEVQKGSALGQQLDATMKEGGLVPVDVTLALLRAAMKASPVKRFLVDGFPRAVDQAVAFEASVAAPNLVLFFDCPLETMQARLMKRGESSGRADDNPATIQKRFDTFLSQSLPVLAHYQAALEADPRGATVHKISAVPPPDQVYTEVAAILRQCQHTFVPGAAPAPAPNTDEPAPAALLAAPAAVTAPSAAREATSALPASVVAAAAGETKPSAPMTATAAAVAPIVAPVAGSGAPASPRAPAVAEAVPAAPVGTAAATEVKAGGSAGGAGVEEANKGAAESGASLPALAATPVAQEAVPAAAANSAPTPAESKPAEAGGDGKAEDDKKADKGAAGTTVDGPQEARSEVLIAAVTSEPKQEAQ
ncbi:adenylate kinase [Klebsormidium nitens]|uniref:adenylate kinase n=1 Tax=Klebsormidium nitens TaxID=105231 RepID=A0A1Y1IJ11_KLENI|nr:adenylate kinase [Klebsormidium nitens]|eukprot:GAQ90693.1 adenylate kinase [Klebsormidium nitens]